MNELFNKLEEHKHDPFAIKFIALWVSNRQMEEEINRLEASMEIDEISGSPFYFEEDPLYKKLLEESS